MKKLIVSVLIFAGAVSPFLYADNASPVPYRDRGKCGYADRDMKITVRAQYDSCGDMINGTASVMKNGKYGFIDVSGKTVIPFVYESSSSFSGGYAVVKKNGRYAVIDRKGEPVIPLTDYSIESYSGGLAVVSKEHKYGIMGDGGRIILPVRFGSVEPAGNSLFVVAGTPVDGGSAPGRYYLYNSRGETVFSESYDIIYPAANGFMKIRNNGKWGYLSPDGAVIAPAIYEDVRNIKIDGTACIRSRGRWGVMNGQGKIIVSAQYDNVGGGEGTSEEESQSRNSWFTVSSGGKWGMISLRGETIARTEYYMIGSGRRGYIPAFKEIDKGNGVKGLGLTLLDSRGWELFSPKGEYNCAGEEGEGLLPAGRGRLMGYINHQGEIVISMEYEDAGGFSGGFAVVKKNGLYGIINRSGRLVEDTVYNDIKRSIAYQGLFEAVLSGKKVYLEPGGKHFWK